MRRDSYLKIGVELTAVIAAMAAVGWFGLPKPKPTPRPIVAAKAPAEPEPVAIEKPVPAAKPEPILDLEAIARAEERVEAARNDRMRAEALAEDAAERLELARTRAASAATSHRVVAASTRDARPRIVAARARGEVLKVERDRVHGEWMALNEAPRPRRKALIDKSPVAKQAEGEEFHFEVRRDRVAFIDLERLLDRVKTDARMQIRMSSGNRPVAGVAGPIGSFSIKYEVGRLDDGSNPRIGNFGLMGWEIVPEQDIRGEPFARTQGPASEFSRAINRLNPERDVVTLWVYPDGFPLYRQLRDTLHARGFLVAARPLPESMPIRGSPSGSSSSAQ